MDNKSRSRGLGSESTTRMNHNNNISWIEPMRSGMGRDLGRLGSVVLDLLGVRA
jgi:hypothetical protein